MENPLVLSGYHLIHSGKVQANDKYWSAKLLAWLPITINDGRDIAEFDAVIRKG